MHISQKCGWCPELLCAQKYSFPSLPYDMVFRSPNFLHDQGSPGRWGWWGLNNPDPTGAVAVPPPPTTAIIQHCSSSAVVWLFFDLTLCHSIVVHKTDFCSAGRPSSSVANNLSLSQSSFPQSKKMFLFNFSFAFIYAILWRALENNDTIRSCFLRRCF